LHYLQLGEKTAGCSFSFLIDAITQPFVPKKTTRRFDPTAFATIPGRGWLVAS
jgi:hypothetical protein